MECPWGSLHHDQYRTCCTKTCSWILNIMECHHPSVLTKIAFQVLMSICNEWHKHRKQMGLEFQTLWKRYTKIERELSNLINQTLLFFAGLETLCNLKSLERWLQRERNSLRNFLSLFKY